MEDLFAHLDVVDQHQQERFAKFQERMLQQLHNMHSNIKSLSIRINTVARDDIFVQEMGNDEEETGKGCR